MQQSNALRRLEEILTEALTHGDKNTPTGPILLRAMKLEEHPHKIMDFYELLNKAGEETRSIRNKPKIDRYIRTIDELHQLFVVYHIWKEAWITFASHIENKDVLNTLDSLADFLHLQNPKIFLEQEFLKDLNNEFSTLLNAVLESDLPRELKRLLTERVEEILKVIRKYHIYGTEGLENATKALVSDLVIGENSLQEQDKENPAYRRLKAWTLSILIYITPSPYDIIGAVPDIHDFWIPKFEKLAKGCKKAEQILYETPMIQEAVEKVTHIFSRNPQKSIAGRTFKALPASREELEVPTDHESTP